jgi:hypothetical protein
VNSQRWDTQTLATTRAVRRTGSTRDFPSRARMNTEKRMINGLKKALFVIAACVAAGGGCGIAPASNATADNSNVSQPMANARPSPSTTTSYAGAQAPEPTPPQGPPPAEAQAIDDAIAVIEQYYDAINSRDYRRAYELWSGNGESSKQTFEQFRRGFANTSSAEFDTTGPGRVEGAAGSEYATIPVRIRAITKPGDKQYFIGEYVLRRSMVEGATAEQQAWRIYSANIKRDKAGSW